MPDAKPQPRLPSFAPQFLVDDLGRSMSYYQKLGFTFGEPWEGFYAIGELDGLELHLKAAPKNGAERRHRREHEHLDAAAGVDGIEAFYEQCVANGVTILRPLTATEWGTKDFAGEVEPCINGQVAASGAYFGQDVQGLVDRQLGEQLADGGWNCEAPDRSTRSSFNTTICVLKALLKHVRAGGGRPVVTAARLRGQEYLLERRLFRRRSTGEVIERDRKGGAAWTRLAFPTWWHYDVLRGLEYLRGAGVAPDERVAEAIGLVASKHDGDGRWPLETRHPGRMLVDTD